MAATSDINRQHRARLDSETKPGEGLSKNLHEVLTQVQQKYRWYLVINGLHAAFIESVTRPGYRVETKEYRLLDYHFKHPTNVKWEDVSFTVKEIFSSNVANSVGGLFMQKLKAAWAPPDQIVPGQYRDLSKSALINALGTIIIRSIDPDGKTYEEWELKQAFIKEVKFSELSYGQDGMTDIRISLSYDWAELKYFGPK